MSLDALRGFDMFWIIGADALVKALRSMSDTGLTSQMATQLEHVDWEGFRFYDLIFPLFVFIVGVSLVFSLTRTIQEVGRGEALMRVFRRSLLLFVIGILYSGGFKSGWPDIRIMGVLNRIALAYFFAGMLFCFFKPRALIGICAGLLVGYWALVTFTPIRDIALDKVALVKAAEERGDVQSATALEGRGNPSTVKNSSAWAAAEKVFYGTTNRVRGDLHEKGFNVVNHFDFQYLPGKKWDLYWDPEGILSTIPAVATCLLGVFAGFWLRNPNATETKKFSMLLVAGIAGIVLGRLWGLEFPIVKKIWTSSYVLLAGGYSALLLGLFYLVVDVMKFQKWCQPFVWIGMNSITIYLVKNIIGGDFRDLASRFVGGDIKTFLDEHVAKGAGSMLLSVVGLGLAFWFVHFLYKRKIFLRL